MPTADEKRQLANIMRELRGVTEVAVKAIGTTVLDEVVRTTPRDTGLSAASWQAKIGGPVTDVAGNRSPGGVARAKAAQEASRAQIAGWSRGTLSIGSGEGNVARLNDGHSPQEPAGFVQRAIASGLKAGEAAATARARAASRGGGGGSR